MRINNRFVAAAFVSAVGAIILVFANCVSGCSRASRFSFDELFAADAIVIARAERYVGTPDLSMTTTGVPDTQIEFKIEEVLRGKDIASTIVLNGYLGDSNDYNDENVPYIFVRPNGRSGSCFANTYKKGAEFLLFLKKKEKEHGYTPNISALGPTNEQLRDTNDPWVSWVKEELGKREKK